MSMPFKRLKLYQTYDPQRGSFIVKDRPVSPARRVNSQKVNVTPCDVDRDGSQRTYSNSFEFIVV